MENYKILTDIMYDVESDKWDNIAIELQNPKSFVKSDEYTVKTKHGDVLINAKSTNLIGNQLIIEPNYCTLIY